MKVEASVGCVSDSVTHHFSSQVSQKHQKTVTGSSNKGALRRKNPRLTHPTLLAKTGVAHQVEKFI